jgi:hypothetical protein
MDEEHLDEERAAAPDAEQADVFDIPTTAALTLPKKRSKGKRNKALATLAIIIVVLIGGSGAAYATTHEDPHFCNFLCHTPMDPYVESYDNNASIVAAEVEATGADGAQLSVTVHKDSEEQEINCLSCHVADLGEQINEGIHWVTGDYTVPLEGITLVDSENPKEGEVSGTEFCLREGCHEVTTRDQLAESTSDLVRNPHSSHLTAEDCSSCHQTHEQSVMLCAQCHNDVEIPEGWITKKGGGVG